MGGADIPFCRYLLSGRVGDSCRSTSFAWCTCFREAHRSRVKGKSKSICKAKPGRGQVSQCQLSSSHGQVHVRHRQQVPHQTDCLRFANRVCSSRPHVSRTPWAGPHPWVLLPLGPLGLDGSGKRYCCRAQQLGTFGPPRLQYERRKTWSSWLCRRRCVSQTYVQVALQPSEVPIWLATLVHMWCWCHGGFGA